MTGILSCLAVCGIFPGAMALPPRGEVVSGDWMLASAEGVFRARCRLGDQVATGDRLAEIHNERGAVRQCFAAQVSGRVLGLRSKAYIRAGDWGVLIGSAA